MKIRKIYQSKLINNISLKYINKFNSKIDNRIIDLRYEKQYLLILIQ
jgi:hypothetical protein